MGTVFTSLDDEGFDRLFHDFKFTAFRLEALQRYGVSYEEGEFGRFLAGESRGTFPGINDWIEQVVSSATALGKRMHRVHVIEEPLSDYVRFECAWGYEHTVRAGEDVRIIAVPARSWPDMPGYDYWLFDSSLLVVMNYDDDGTFVSAEVVDDPRKVLEANYWRDVMVHRSIPYRQFADRYDPQFLRTKTT